MNSELQDIIRMARNKSQICEFTYLAKSKFISCNSESENLNSKYIAHNSEFVSHNSGNKKLARLHSIVSHVSYVQLVLLYKISQLCWYLLSCYFKCIIIIILGFSAN